MDQEFYSIFKIYVHLSVKVRGRKCCLIGTWEYWSILGSWENALLEQARILFTINGFPTIDNIFIIVFSLAVSLEIYFLKLINSP